KVPIIKPIAVLYTDMLLININKSDVILLSL
mgnify:CR=1